MIPTYAYLYSQGMHKNWVKNVRIFLKFHLFYLANEDIQSRKIQNNIYILNVSTPFFAEFPRSENKRAVLKCFQSFSTLFLYRPIIIFWSFSISVIVLMYMQTTFTLQIISDGIPVDAKGKSKCQSKHYS